MCFLEMIDTAGIEEYAAMRDEWIRDGQGFILVYSVTSRYTFEFLQQIHQSVRRIKPDNPTIMLVGNKCDRTQEREVSKADGAALARQFGCEFIETSAKNTQNIERLFINLIRSLRQKKLTKDAIQELHPRRSAKKLEEKESCKCVIF